MVRTPLRFGRGQGCFGLTHGMHEHGLGHSKKAQECQAEKA